jgi:hypothetical protein
MLEAGYSLAEVHEVATSSGSSISNITSSSHPPAAITSSPHSTALSPPDHIALQFERKNM